MDWVNRLKTYIQCHEGLRLAPYLDSVGKVTIGYGRNLTDKGINEAEAHYMFMRDIGECIRDARLLLGEHFDALGDARKCVVCDMVFNLGVGKLGRFRKFLAALEQGEWAVAADEMENSLWAKQVKSRAVKLVRMMREDVFL